MNTEILWIVRSSTGSLDPASTTERIKLILQKWHHTPGATYTPKLEDILAIESEPKLQTSDAIKIMQAMVPAFSKDRKLRLGIWSFHSLSVNFFQLARICDIVANFRGGLDVSMILYDDDTDCVHHVDFAAISDLVNRQIDRLASQPDTLQYLTKAIVLGQSKLKYLLLSTHYLRRQVQSAQPQSAQPQRALVLKNEGLTPEFQCGYCVEYFAAWDKCIDHVRRRHMDRRSWDGLQAIRICDQCEKPFLEVLSLKRHQERAHPGEECDILQIFRLRVECVHCQVLVELNEWGRHLSHVDQHGLTKRAEIRHWVTYEPQYSKTHVSHNSQEGIEASTMEAYRGDALIKEKVLTREIEILESRVLWLVNLLRVGLNIDNSAKVEEMMNLRTSRDDRLLILKSTVSELEGIFAERTNLNLSKLPTGGIPTPT